MEKWVVIVEILIKMEVKWKLPTVFLVAAVRIFMVEVTLSACRIGFVLPFRVENNVGQFHN